jgi:hypothetical protein
MKSEVLNSQDGHSNETSNESNKGMQRLVLIGDAGVGKSSLLKQWTAGEFCDQYVTTIGVDIKMNQVEVNGQSIALQIVSERLRAHALACAHTRLLACMKCFAECCAVGHSRTRALQNDFGCVFEEF